MAVPLTVQIADGTIPFPVPDADKDCFTYYKVYGDLLGGKIPLIALHGGPGAGHEYMQGFQDITTQHQIPVILYDQIGCGKSTALPEKNGDEAFWTVELFERELQNVVDHFNLAQYDLMGHSWGGQLASMFASKHPDGLRKLILMSAPASLKLEIEGTVRLRKELPIAVQKILQHYIAREDYEAPEFKAASLEFYKRFVCRIDPWPEEVLASMAHLDEDPTVYGTMLGPCELVCTGSLKDWSAVSHAHRIKNSTLLVNGEFDEIIESTSAPFFEEIPKVRWLITSDSSHMNMWEQREKVMGVVSDFLLGYP